MKNLITGSILLSASLFASQALAFQETTGVVVSSHVDGARQICTITIDRKHPRTNRTNQCRNRTFSWGCLYDDYRYDLAEHSQKNRVPIKLRYSEYHCDARTKNMQLLTVW